MLFLCFHSLATDRKSHPKHFPAWLHVPRVCTTLITIGFVFVAYISFHLNVSFIIVRNCFLYPHYPQHLGHCTGEGNGYLLQYFPLGNPMGRGATWATVQGGVAKEFDKT